MTIEEAATYLNVPARWVADAVRQRKVRCTRIGKHIRFRVEHLDELVAAGEQPVTSDVIPIQGNRARNRSSGLDCFTLDCFGAVPIAGFAAR